MTILLFLFGVAVAAGLFFILADILKLPRLSTEKALLSAGRAEKKQMKSLDAIFLGWAIKISHFIRMDDYKRHRMERTLSAAGMDMTPEVYLAYTILKPAAALLAVRLCPRAEYALLASHVSKEPAARMVLEALGLRPFLQAEMCLGEGTGAVAVMPLLEMALAVYRGMTTFEETNIEAYVPQD